MLIRLFPVSLLLIPTLVLAFVFTQTPHPPAEATITPTSTVTVAPASPTATPIVQPTSTMAAAPTSVPITVAEPTDAAPLAITQRVPIIEYHYSTFNMGEGVRMKPEWFEEQMRWLAENGFTTLTDQQLADFVAGTYWPPERSVALTFDVGASKFDDYTEVVIPTLRRYGFHAIFFVLASRTVDECDGENTCWPTLAEWQAEGLISVGSHSWSHIDYATMTPEQIVMDAGRSKKLIEEKLGMPVVGICYPFDSPNPAAFSLLETLGYKFAVGGHTRNDRVAVSGDAEPYNLPRLYPYSGEDFYPVIGGTGGLTFAEMMLAAAGDGQ
jgi:peptidoglycan/xylan/chitin deacetylase (PgdA/CDA1 family)